MKTALVFLFALVAVASVHSQGIPTRKCPPGEHSVLYCPQMAEPSCDNPSVHELAYGGLCDVPQCFCNEPNVRDTKTGKCVRLSQCKK